MDQGAGAGYDGGGCVILPSDAMKSRLGFPVIALAHAHDRDQAGVTEHVDTRIRQLQRAAIGIAVHRCEFLLGHLLHPHAAGVKGETLRLDALARPEHRRNLRLHRGVGARYDLTDAVIAPICHWILLVQYDWFRCNFLETRLYE